MGFTSNIKKVEGYVDDWQNRALASVGKFIDSQAILLCPAGSYNRGGYAGSGKVGGNLQGSMKWYVNKKEKFVRNGTAVIYSIYVEKGTGIFAKDSRAKKIPWRFKDDMGIWHTTSGMIAQPFLTPAAENNLNKIKEIIQREKFASGTD